MRSLLSHSLPFSCWSVHFCGCAFDEMLMQWKSCGFVHPGADADEYEAGSFGGHAMRTQGGVPAACQGLTSLP
jgi:hypothetical protein